MPATLAEAYALVMSQNQRKCIVQKWLDTRSTEDRECFDLMVSQKVSPSLARKALLEIDDVDPDELFGDTALRRHMLGACACPR